MGFRISRINGIYENANYGDEKGFPFQYVEYSDNKNDHDEKNLNLVPEPLVKDDQAIVVNLREKGLVALTGCGHAGIINTLNYAKELTGVDKIHAIIGGFHLPADGGIYEQAMNPTIEEIQNADPEYIIPCHCTGWEATNKIIDLMPDKFIQSAVGHYIYLLKKALREVLLLLKSRK